MNSDLFAAVPGELVQNLAVDFDASDAALFPGLDDFGRSLRGFVEVDPMELPFPGLQRHLDGVDAVKDLSFHSDQINGLLAFMAARILNSFWREIQTVRRGFGRKEATEASDLRTDSGKEPDEDRFRHSGQQLKS